MKKIYVYSIILFLFFLGACSKEEIKLYSIREEFNAG